MKEKWPPVPVERVAGSNRSLAAATAIVVVGLLLLVAKPWAGSAERPLPELTTLAAAESVPPPRPEGADRVGASPAGTSTPTDGPAGIGTASPTPNAELALALARQQCQNPTLWRVVTHERTGSIETHSLFPISPVGARGPADPVITAATIHASQLLGIGYCIPTALDPDVAAVERRILIWKQSGAGRYAAVRDVTVLDQGLFKLGEAYLGPPAGASATTWPAGRYVFEIQDGAADGAARWFALDFAPTD